MDNELIVIHSFTNDLWKWIKSTDGMTEDRWEEVLEQAKAITNDPKYASIRQMAIEWILAYENHLEEKMYGKR